MPRASVRWEHRRFKRGTASIRLRSEGSWTSHNGVFCKLSRGRDDFLGGRHENSSVFGGQPAGFTSNSVGTRLKRGTPRPGGALGSEVVGIETAFVTGRRDEPERPRA